jgi:TonB family protein
VVVGLTVNADGTVSDLAIQSSTHPQMDAAVLEAVQQWRYEPIRVPRAHAVQVVLHAGG